MTLKPFLFALILALTPLTPFMPAITETPIYAKILEDTNIYRDRSLCIPIDKTSSGDIVEILEDYSKVVYKIAKDSTVGWVAAKHLKIPPDTLTDKTILTADILEDFVNTQGYESLTDYLILTDINRQKTHIFEGIQKNFILLKSFGCSTGLNVSPTTRGIFSLSDRGEWFYSYRLNSGARFWIRFNGHYLFHSIPMDINKDIIEGEDTVGQKSSSGCIRLLLPDIEWIFNNIPDATTVVII
jgi:hypothetical protein